MPTPYTTSRKGQYKIVPVLVGALKEEKEAAYGQLFSKYLARPENLFVVSSDFCHWGECEGSLVAMDITCRKVFSGRRGLSVFETLLPACWPLLVHTRVLWICN